jgi:acetyl esterase/lipase
MKRWLLSSLCLLVLAVPVVKAQDKPEFTRTEDVIYGRKFGLAMTYDVLTPKNPNGAAVIFVVSGGWFSRKENINPAAVVEFLKRGYTVFAVVHGSQPRFNIPEIIEDMDRSVRHIRMHAADYKIDPLRIGITGGSAGGHLSLMQGMAGDTGDPKAKEPVLRASSRVQCVACFFPPTDFLNWGKEGHVLNSKTVQEPFKAAFDFREIDPVTKLSVTITDEDKIKEICKKISPITHVTSDDPPTLIIHGDKDTLVPIQQAEIMVKKLKEVNVPAELIVKEGGGHGWADMGKDMVKFADWFDKYLVK